MPTDKQNPQTGSEGRTQVQDTSHQSTTDTHTVDPNLQDPMHSGQHVAPGNVGRNMGDAERSGNPTTEERGANQTTPS